MQLALFSILKFFIAFLLFNILPAIGLVFYFFRGENKLNSVDKYVISAILSPCILIFFSSMEGLLGIPQHKIVLGLNFFAISAFNIFLFKKYKIWRDLRLPVLAWKKDWQLLLAYLFFILLIFVRVFPATLIPTPITADPIAHAEWLRILNTTGFVTGEQWYPQGIEYFLNYFSSFTFLAYPKTILLFTNYFSAIFPIGMFYLVLLFSKASAKQRFFFAFSAFVIASLVPYPKELYYTSGKNSFVFALAMTPIIFLLAHQFRDRIAHLLLSMMAFSIFMIHFPTGIMVYFIFLPLLIPNIFSHTGNALALNKENFASLLYFALPTIIFLALLAFHIAPIYKNHPPTEDRSMAASAQSITQPVSHFIQSLWYSQSDVYEYKPCLTARFLTDKNICKKFGLDKDSVTISFFFLFLAGFLWYLIRRPEKFINRVIIGHVLAAGVIMILLSFSDKVPGFFMAVEYQIFFTLIFILIVAWFVSSSTNFFSGRLSAKISLAFLAIISLIFLIGNAESFSNYLKKQKPVSTGPKELKAFEFIMTLPADNKKILVSLYNVGNKIIAGADAGIWIPSYTGRPIEVDWLDFSQTQSFEIYALFKNLVDDPNDSISLKKLVCEYNIGYVFQGSRNQRKSSTIQAEKNSNFKILYNNGAKIYKIDNIECNK